MLRSDYSVSCQSATYAFFNRFAVIMVFVWPLGVPALFAVILVSNRRVLRNDAKDKVPTTLDHIIIVVVIN